MRVCVVGAARTVRAVAALGVALSASGHELVVAGESSPGTYGLEALATSASGSDIVVGVGPAGPWAVSAAELVGVVGVLAETEAAALPTRDFAPATTVRPPRRLNRPVSSALDAVGWVRDGHGVNQARRAAGLGPMSNPWHELPVLGAWSPALVPTPADWDTDRVTVTGDWWVADDAAWDPDERLEAFLAVGDRPIYVGLAGVGGSLAEYTLESILEAWADTYRILLDVGPLGSQLRLPENVHRVESVPSDWLFGRCGALVFECGAVRAHAAARSGVPSIPVPFTPAQRFWGDRLYATGIATKPVDPRSGWEAYKAALRATIPLRDPAREIAGRVGSEDGAAVAVRTLEAMLRSTHL